MKLRNIFVFALPILSLVSCSNYLPSEERNKELIVELQDDVSQNAFLSYVRNNVTNNVKVNNTYTYIANAITLEINEEYVDDIENLSFVKHIDENRYHECSLESLYGSNTSTLSVPSANYSALTMNKPSSTNEGEGVAIAILDDSFYINHECYSDLDSGTTLKYTQQSIQDTIEGTSFHGKPDSTHTTYYNRKVPYYYDYGGSTTSTEKSPTPDYDVYSSVDYHGHHVASIAGGNGSLYQGIAPKCQLLLMKVFTDLVQSGSSTALYCIDDTILSALEDCAILGVDIINLSLGNDLNDFSNDSLVVRKIKELQNNGTFVNIAAGNTGKNSFSSFEYGLYDSTQETDLGYLSEYSNIYEAMIVGSCTTNVTAFDNGFKINGVTIPYLDQVISRPMRGVIYSTQHRLTDLISGGTYTYDYVKIPGYGEESDYEGLSVSGKIAIVDRGTTTFESKVKIAISHGAIAVVIINNSITEDDLSFICDFNGYNPTVPVVTVRYSDRNTIIANSSLEIQTGEVYVTSDAKQSYFSSNGPTYDLDIKPDITTPGSYIVGATYGNGSTISKTSYGTLSGTSMASPNFCGAVAIMLSNHLGDETYRSTINSRLMSNSELIKDSEDTSLYVSPRFQGAGLVDLDKAITNTLYLDGYDSKTNSPINKGKILLRNDSNVSQGKLQLKFDAYNESSSGNYEAKIIVYVPQTTYVGDNTTDKVITTHEEKIAEINSDVSLNSGKNTVTLNYELTAEKKAELNSIFPNGCYIEGYVVITNKVDSSLSATIPYLGFYGNYSTSDVVEPFNFEKDTTKIYPSTLLNESLHEQSSYQNADFSSMIVQGSTSSISDVDVDSVANNSKAFNNLDSFSEVNATKIGDTWTINVDIDNVNTLVVQQYVMHSVTSNTLKITRNSDGKIMTSDNMFDMLTDKTNLYKSRTTVDLVSSGSIAHRAYTILPLYETQTTTGFGVGTYTMTFTFNTAYGSTNTYTYQLNIYSGSGSSSTSAAPASSTSRTSSKGQSSTSGGGGGGSSSFNYDIVVLLGIFTGILLLITILGIILTRPRKKF